MTLLWEQSVILYNKIAKISTYAYTNFFFFKLGGTIDPQCPSLPPSTPPPPPPRGNIRVCIGDFGHIWLLRPLPFGLPLKVRELNLFWYLSISWVIFWIRNFFIHKSNSSVKILFGFQEKTVLGSQENVGKRKKKNAIFLLLSNFLNSQFLFDFLVSQALIYLQINMWFEALNWSNLVFF